MVPASDTPVPFTAQLSGPAFPTGGPSIRAGALQRPAWEGLTGETVRRGCSEGICGARGYVGTETGLGLRAGCEVGSVAGSGQGLGL